MHISLRRTLKHAWLIAGVCALASPSGAQKPRLAPAEIGQIVDGVLGTVLAPTDSLSRVQVSKRSVVLDHARTMAAFGYPGTRTRPADIGIRSDVATGSESLLSDCNSWGEKPCHNLGWRGYVWIEPLSISGSTALVRAYVSWPARPGTTFVKGVAPTGKAYLTSFAADVRLARAANGVWKVVGRGNTLTGD